MKNSRLIALILLSLLTGCATIKTPPTDIYTISPVWKNNESGGQHKDKSALVIKLAPIKGARAFSSNQILYSDSHYGQNGYAYSRWSDAPVKLLQILFQIALEENDQFSAVVPPTSASDADFLLESNLYDFSYHLNDDGTSDGVIRVSFHLVDNTTKSIIATKVSTSRVPALSQNAQAAVVALNKAAFNVTRELLSWLAESGKL